MNDSEYVRVKVLANIENTVSALGKVIAYDFVLPHDEQKKNQRIQGLFIYCARSFVYRYLYNRKGRAERRSRPVIR